MSAVSAFGLGIMTAAGLLLIPAVVSAWTKRRKAVEGL